ncbi:DUF1175 domain-containing protein [Massilia horti]|nr:DUF1175 family protein [Massilia horti]
MNKRRGLLRLAAVSFAASAAAPAGALTHALRPQPRLTQAQSRAFQAWMIRIVSEQVNRGPSPRWHHRDCAGLVRFAVNEALAVHDAKWMRANGIRSDARLPPELELTAGQANLRNRWVQTGGTVGHFVTAIALVQNNSRFVAREVSQALPGDLLFYDQGDMQHLMVWMGTSIAYHTGTVTTDDNGLRMVGIRQLMNWKDTRWQPAANNPNFAGVYRLMFLS